MGGEVTKPQSLSGSTGGAHCALGTNVFPKVFFFCQGPAPLEVLLLSKVNASEILPCES
jgi:hypothetical protein